MPARKNLGEKFNIKDFQPIFKMTKKQKRSIAEAKTKYPFKELKVGEAYTHYYTDDELQFDIHSKRQITTMIATSLRNCAFHMALKNGYKRHFIQRMEKVDGVPLCVRIIRTE